MKGIETVALCARRASSAPRCPPQRSSEQSGHGIGLFEHEDPYIIEGNAAALEVGNAFSIEPGIYLEGRWGARLEDIVVATDAGPQPLNKVDHHLAIVDA